MLIVRMNPPAAVEISGVPRQETPGSTPNAQERGVGHSARNGSENLRSTKAGWLV